jgi:hypothetical protein
MTSPESRKVEIFYYSFNKEQEVKALIIKLFNNIITKEEFKNYYMKIYEMDIPPNINIENEKSMHTSMSVGDIIKINDHYFGVSSFGLKKIIFNNPIVILY